MNKEIVNDAIFAVEQQLNSKETRYVREIYEIIVSRGVSEKEAKIKIASALLKEADYIHSNGGEFSEERYKNYLNELL